MADRTWSGHRGRVILTVNDYDVIDCHACGFKHVVPLPSREDLDRIYREEYYTQEKPGYLASVQKDRDWWELVYRDRFAIFEEFLSAEERSLLDIGSGPGLFLLEGKKRGWTVKGIEPSRQAASFSRGLGLDICEDFLSQDTAPNLGRFHAVHLSNVLEHIPDPLQILSLAHSLLHKDGLLAIITPNDFNPIQNALQRACEFQPWWAVPPHHLNYFDFASLARLMERCGFEVVFQEATFPIDLFLLMGDNYVGNDALGRACHERRMRLEQNLDRAGLTNVKHALYQAFAAAGLGREVFMVARKRD